MKLTDTVFSALNSGKDLILQNLQFVHPGTIYTSINNLGKKENFFASGDSLTQDTSGSLFTDVSGITSSLKGMFSKLTTNNVFTNSQSVDAPETTPSTATSTSTSTATSTSSIIVIIINSISYGLYIIIVLTLASLVANHMIMQPVIMRIISFSIAAVLTITNPLVFFSIMAYYIIFALLRYYYNTTVDKQFKKSLIPYIFTLLPISTTIPSTSLGAFFMYPFYYSPPNVEAPLLRERMNYLDSINNSFPNLKQTMAVSGFKGIYDILLKTINENQAYPVKDENDNVIDTRLPFKT